MRISKLEPRTQPVYKLTLTLEELQKLWHLLNMSSATISQALRGYHTEDVPFLGVEDVDIFKHALWRTIDSKVRPNLER